MDMSFFKSTKYLILLFALSISGLIEAKTEFLLMPSNQDLTELSTLFEKTGKPLPVHFIFNNEIGEAIFGIGISKRARNGVHARLLVEAGIVNNLADAKKTKHGYKAGTFFLEQQDGKPVLSVHGRNSHRSTVNTQISGGTSSSVPYPDHLLYQVYHQTGLPVVEASIELDKAIREGNKERYVLEGMSEQEKAKAISYNELDVNIEFKSLVYESGLDSMFDVVKQLSPVKNYGNEYHQEQVEKIIKAHEPVRSCRQILP